MALIILLAIGFLVCAVIDIALDQVNDKLERESKGKDYAKQAS